MKKAIFPGSFDPFHEGHEFIVSEALKEFDFIYIIISWNEKKITRKHSFENVYDFLVKKYKNNNNIEILINKNELTTAIANRLNCFNLIRGYRNKIDYKYEQNLKTIYQNQEPQIKIFYYHNDSLKHISSTNLKK